MGIGLHTAQEHEAALLPGERLELALVGGAAAVDEVLLLVLLLWLLTRIARRRLGSRPALRGDVGLPGWTHGLALGLTAAMLWGAEPPREPPHGVPGPDDTRPPRTWLVTLDTLRIDHISAVGGGRRVVPTPNLDALAARCTLFTRGVSPAPLTLPAHLAMLTGEEPLALGVVRNGVTLGADVATLAEARTVPLQSAAFVSSAILRGSTGLGEGFDHYDDRFGLVDRLSLLPHLGPLLRWLDLPAHERRADETLARVRRWLAVPAWSNRFIWVHLYDPHSPYAAPEGWRGLTPWDEPGAPGNPAEMRQVRSEIRASGELFLPLVPIDLRRPIAAYADEVRWTDHALGELLALVGDDPLIVAADHGESLTEHGALLSHGSQVSEPTTRVPIFDCLDRDAPARRVETPAPLSAVGVSLRWKTLAVHHTPLTNTLAHWARGDRPHPPILTIAGEMQSRDQPMTRHGWELALRDGEVKWVSGRDGALRRYLPASDPGERADTAGSRPEAERARLQSQFDEIRNLLEGLPAPDEQDAEAESALRALGYVE